MSSPAPPPPPHVCGGRLSACGACGERRCGPCLNHALVTAGDLAERGAYDAPARTLCRACFIANSPLDFSSVAPDVLGPAGAPCVVFVHGGGGCRTMFRAAAAALAARRAVRAVLLDLPGHGARMDEPLSMAAAIASVRAQAAEFAPPTARGAKPVYVGGSLGGYIGMEVLGAAPEQFAGAVIAMAGQDVGPGRGCAASVGLVAMGLATSWLAPATLLNAMRGEARRNGHIPGAALADTLRPGFFFQQARAQLDVMRASDPRAALPRYGGPVLFVNGSRDHRDSERVWRDAAPRGRLEVYEGADHFLSHDDRYAARFVEDIAGLCAEAWGADMPGEGAAAEAAGAS